MQPEPPVSPEQANLRLWVERLAIPRHIVANARNNRHVADVLATAFEALDLVVSRQGIYGNVVALPRRCEGQRVTFVSAHYDSVPHCPGADDNASGLAVMLECARMIQQQDPRAPVGFVAFNAEEDGLLGSRDFVERGLVELPCRLGTTHVLEMLGYRSAHDAPPSRPPLWWMPKSVRAQDYVALLGMGPSNKIVGRARKLQVSPNLRVLTAKTLAIAHKLAPDITRSDHMAYWERDVPATLWTDTGDFRNPNYHRASDTPSTLDYDFMTEITALVHAVVLDEAAH